MNFLSEVVYLVFKSITCKHEWQKTKRIHGDGINYYNARTEYKCSKCNLYKYKN